MTGNFLNDLTTAFVAAIHAGTLVLQTVSLPLLAVLAAIAFHRELWPSLFSGGAYLGESLGHFFYMLLRVGFFMWLCANLIQIADAALDTFLTWGVTPADFHVSLENLRAPAWILDQGFLAAKDIVAYMYNTMNWNLTLGMMFFAFFYSLAYWCIVAGFAIIALHLSALIIEFSLAVMCATVALPWGIFQHTAFLGEFVIGWVTGGVIRAFILAAMVGISVPLLTIIQPTMSIGGDPSFFSVILMGVGSLFFAYLCWTIPARAAHIAGRGVSLAFHGGSVVSAAMGSTRWAMMTSTQMQGAVRGTSQMLQAMRA